MKPTKLIAIFSVLFSTCSQAQPAIPEANKINGFAIGCQAYSFKLFTVFEAIEKTAQAGGKVIEFYPGQKLSAENPELKFSHNSGNEVIEQVQAALAKHGVLAVNYGVVAVPAQEAQARKIFEFARKLGLYGITTESVESLELLEKLALEYNVTVSFHNHPRRENNPEYKVWDPAYILGLLQGRDPRLGACADVGHWSTSGLDPLECVRLLKGRITSIHLKDRDLRGRGARDVPAGAGVLEIGAILKELKSQGFRGNISIEHENNWENSVPQIRQGIEFVRGLR